MTTTPNKKSTYRDVIREDERVQVFIDGPNLFNAARGLGFDIDYKKLREEFGVVGKFIRASYYTGIIDSDEPNPLLPLVDWLDYNGYTLVTRVAREYTDQNGDRRYKGNMDVELAVDMLESNADHVVLFSGDGDFVPVVESLKRRGVRVTVISSIKSQPPMISNDLRRAADNFVDLQDLQTLIARPPRDNTQDRSSRYT